MTSTPDDARPRRWRRVYIAALLVPMLPTLGLLAISGLAGAAGCKADLSAVCRVGPLSLGQAFGAAVIAARLVGELMVLGTPVLTALCCRAVHRWRAGLPGRLGYSLLAAVFLAYLPFFGPLMAIDGLIWSGCRVNEGGVGPCAMFGVDIGPAIHGLAVLPWATIFGGVAILIWGVYAVIAIVLRLRQRWRGAAA